jgi:hypothetical protein
MKIAIVGSTSLTLESHAAVRYLVSFYVARAKDGGFISACVFKEDGTPLNKELRIPAGEKATIISGGAKGIDTVAATLADKAGLDVIEYVPAVRGWRSGMPDGFEARNKKIAEDCDLLVCIRDKNSKTYGSGWTRDYAIKLGKPTVSFLIDPANTPGAEHIYTYEHTMKEFHKPAKRKRRAKAKA